MTAYHDDEWGRPVIDERELYERFCLEGFQSGLSWRTVLNKRPAFREVFADFDPEEVAEFGDDDVDRLLQDARIISHRRKIEATIGNARAVLALRDSGRCCGTCSGPTRRRGPGEAASAALRSSSHHPGAIALSKGLRKLGFAFVGPTTTYASMQACGIVNDHLTDCPFRDKVEAERDAALASLAP